MELTVLGKYGGYPPKNGGTSSYLVCAGGGKILLDAGSGCLSRLQNYCDFKELDAIVLSHLHYDHIAEMLILQYALKSDIPVYMPSTPKLQYTILSDAYNSKVIQDGLCIKIKDITISFCKVKHSVETYSVKICSEEKTLVYSSDTKYCKELTNFAKDADALLIDSGFLSDTTQKTNLPHMFVAEAGKTAWNANVQKLYLTHINPLYDETRILFEAKEFFNNSVIVGENTSYIIGG